MTSPPDSLAEALALAEGRTASLKSRLSEYRSESSRLRPDIAKLYDQLVERLDALDRGEVGPRLGEPMPGLPCRTRKGSS